MDVGTYATEWFGVESRETRSGGDISVEGSGAIGFSAPFETGPAALYLTKTGR